MLVSSHMSMGFPVFAGLLWQRQFTCQLSLALDISVGNVLGQVGPTNRIYSCLRQLFKL